MTVTADDRAAFGRFNGYWQSNTSEMEVWEHAYAAFVDRNPGTGVTQAEFQASMRNRGAMVQDVAGEASEGNDFRLRT